MAGTDTPRTGVVAPGGRAGIARRCTRAGDGPGPPAPRDRSPAPDEDEEVAVAANGDRTAPHDRSPGPAFSQEVDCRAGVVRGRGRLTTSTAGLLRATVEALVREGHRRVVLDLSDLRDADEPGLRAVSSLRAGIEQAGGRLTVLPCAAPLSS